MTELIAGGELERAVELLRPVAGRAHRSISDDDVRTGAARIERQLGPAVADRERPRDADKARVLRRIGVEDVRARLATP